MTSGIGLSEILLILILIIIFVDAKQIVMLVRTSLKVAARIRAEVRTFFAGIGRL